MFQKKYLEDPDLAFLPECSNEDLKTFADLLVYDKDDKPRISEELSKTRTYKEFYPKELNKICREIIHEFQLFGGDAVANAVRGHGVPYRQILMDVCDRNKVNYNKNSSTERIEMCFEWDRFFDLVRQKRAASVIKTYGSKRANKRGYYFREGVNEIFPIPQSEIDVSNGVVTQNPGY